MEPRVFPIHCVRFLSSVYFKPTDLLFAAVRFRDCGVEYFPRCPPNVRSRSVPLDEANDGIIGNGKLSVRNADFVAG